MTGDMLWIGKQRGAALQNDKYTAVFWVGVGLIKVGLALAFAQIGFDSFDSGSVGILRIQFTVLYTIARDPLDQTDRKQKIPIPSGT